MKITVETSRKQRKAKKSPLQRRFDKLSAQVEREDRRMRRLRSEMDALVRELHAAGLEADRRHLDALVALAERLTVFSGRKTLSNWHREDMAEWFGNLVNRIGRIDESRREYLLDAYKASIAGLLGISVEEFIAQINAKREERPAEEEAFEDVEDPFEASTESPFQDELFDDAREKDPAWEEPEHSGPRSKDDFFEDLFGAAPEAHKDLTDEAWIKRLFRRAAQQLHPDRESDDKTREEKARCMRELLQARREGDLLGLLRIYGETLGETSLDLAEEQMTALCDALEARLEAIEQETARFLMEHPDRMMAHGALYSPSKTQRRKNLQRWRKQALDNVGREARLAEDMPNLTALKNILNDRRDHEEAMRLEIMNAFRENWPEDFEP